MRRRTVLSLSLVLAATFLSVPIAALAWHGSKTITSISGTLTNPGTMTGTISVSKIPGGTKLILVDAFQGLPNNNGGGTCDSNSECERDHSSSAAHTSSSSSGDEHSTPSSGDSSPSSGDERSTPTGTGGSNANRFYQGSYTVTFTNCVGGTATGGTETIGAGGSYPGSPPTNGGAPTFKVDPNATSMTCDYSVTFAGTAPSGTITGIQNDVWMLFGGSVQAAFLASQSPAAVVPEAPVAILVPLTGLAALGAALFVSRRRTADASHPSVT
jgi:hypothetical protein